MAAITKYYNRIFHVFFKKERIQYNFSNVLINSFHNLALGAFKSVRLPQTRSILTSVVNLSEKKLEKTTFQVKKVVTEDGVVEKKTKLFVPRITLYTPEDDMHVITIEEATKLAKRRNLKMVLVTERDPKSERAVYKLISMSEYVKDHQGTKGKTSASPKPEKVISMTSKIEEHDLQAKINHILKWLTKERSVRVIITGSSENMKAAELVYDAVVQGVGNLGRILQKISKHGEIKFQVIPPKKPKVQKKEESDEKIENTP